MIRNARSLGIDSTRIAIAGQSAGGGLAAALVNRLHNRPHDTGPQPRAQWLLSPMLDDRTAARTNLDHRSHPVWSNRSNRYGWSSYLDIPLAKVGSVDAPPGAVPARETNFAGLPPTWIGVGTIDLFHDEDCSYAGALSGAGVDTTLVTVPGAPMVSRPWRYGLRYQWPTSSRHMTGCTSNWRPPTTSYMCHRWNRSGLR